VGRETLVNLLMALRHLSPQGWGLRHRTGCSVSFQTATFAGRIGLYRGVMEWRCRVSVTDHHKLLQSQHFGCDSFHLETHQRNVTNRLVVACQLSVDTALCRPIGRTCSTRFKSIPTVPNSMLLEVTIRKSSSRLCVLFVHLATIVVFNGIPKPVVLAVVPAFHLEDLIPKPSVC
jgi:hypothetical protein